MQNQRVRMLVYGSFHPKCVRIQLRQNNPVVQQHPAPHTLKRESCVPGTHYANIYYYHFMEIHHHCVTNSCCNFVTEQSFLIRTDCLVNVLPAHTMDEHTLLGLSELVQISPNTTLHRVAQTTHSTHSAPRGRSYTQGKPNCTMLVPKLTKQSWQKAVQIQNIVCMVIFRNQLNTACIPKALPEVQKKFVTNASVNKALCCYQRK